MMYNHDDDSSKTNASSHLFSNDLCANSFYLCQLEKVVMRLSLCPVSSCCDVGNIKWGRSKTTKHRNIDHKKKAKSKRQPQKQ